MPCIRELARPVGFLVPNDSARVGLPLAAQWICLDPAANSLGITTSDGVHLVIGSGSAATVLGGRHATRRPTSHIASSPGALAHR